MSAPERAPRPRGVRLGDLDRSKRYVIAYTGRRWEVVGPEGAGAPESDPAPDAGAGDGVASTVPEPGRHAAPPPPGSVGPWE